MKGFKCDFSEEPDFVDFYGNAVMVAISKGRVLLKCITTPAILHMVNFLRKTGVFCEITPSGVFIDGSKTTLKFSNGFSRANETTYKHNPRPWPGFPVDCLPSFIALVSTHGFTSKDITINNWMYEDGLKYVEQLQELGATIETYPTEFGMQKITASSSKRKLASHGEVMIEGVPVIEGVRALISYANQEIGTVIINDIAPILRRSPNFIVNLQSLGVNINIIP
jgi:UDP-N-acetylglucosamine enolpyruvyl transferase